MRAELRFADCKKEKKKSLQRGKFRLNPYHSAKKRGTGDSRKPRKDPDGNHHRERLRMGAFQPGLHLGHPTCSAGPGKRRLSTGLHRPPRAAPPAPGEEAAAGGPGEPRSSARPRGRRAGRAPRRPAGRRRGGGRAGGSAARDPLLKAPRRGKGPRPLRERKAQLTPRSSSERKSGPSSRPSC